MSWRIALTACLTATMLAAAPARGCVPWPAPPMLPGESQEAYKARADALMRQQVAEAKRARQADAVERADVIFVGRAVDWYPPVRLPRVRPGQPPPPAPMPRLDFPLPSYFKPVAWFRGGPSTDLFALRGSNTSCGPTGFGDTGFAMKGDLFVFFARRGPLTQRTMIDAIAVDDIVDPALLDFVARYRKPAAGAALPPL